MRVVLLELIYIVIRIALLGVMMRMPGGLMVVWPTLPLRMAMTVVLLLLIANDMPNLLLLLLPRMSKSSLGALWLPRGAYDLNLRTSTVRLILLQAAVNYLVRCWPWRGYYMSMIVDMMVTIVDV